MQTLRLKDTDLLLDEEEILYVKKLFLNLKT